MSALPRPDLAAGPHHDLNDALHDLQVAAHRRWVDTLDPEREPPYVGAGADGRWPS